MRTLRTSWIDVEPTEGANETEGERQLFNQSSREPSKARADVAMGKSCKAAMRSLRLGRLLSFRAASISALSVVFESAYLAFQPG